MARMTCTHNVVASNGEYQDRNTGETKKRWQKVGVVMTDPEGNQSIKLDVIPVGPNWSGWFKLFPRDARDGSGGNGGGSSPDDLDGDEIPF